MSRFKLCFIFDDDGSYRPVPHSMLMDGEQRKPEFENRYFIPLNGFLLEVTREDYLDFYKDMNRRGYIRKEAQRIGEVSLDALAAIDEEAGTAADDFTERIIEAMLAESLRDAVASLCDGDRLLVRLLYYDGQTEAQCAGVLGISQSTVSRRRRSILEKLRNNLDFDA